MSNKPERLYTLDGEEKPLREWCRQYGRDTQLVRNRLRINWSLREALTLKKNEERREPMREIEVKATVDIIDEIYCRMKHNHIKQKQLAQRVGVTPQSIAHKLRGETELYIHELIQIADLVGFDIILREKEVADEHPRQMDI